MVLKKEYSMSSSLTSLSKISYRQQMSVESRLDHLRERIVDFSEKAKDALDSVQVSFSCSPSESLSGRVTPPHIAIEYIDLVLIPEGYYLKRQLDSVKNWLENYQSPEWVRCKGDNTCRRLLFSVDTPIQNLTTCRDNFRKAMAPLEEKTPAVFHSVAATSSCAVKHVVDRLVKGALDGYGFMPAGDTEAYLANANEFQVKGLYNQDSYSQQVLQALHPEQVQDDSDDDCSLAPGVKSQGFALIGQVSEKKAEVAKESINGSLSSGSVPHNNSVKSFKDTSDDSEGD